MGDESSACEEDDDSDFEEPASKKRNKKAPTKKKNKRMKKSKGMAEAAVLLESLPIMKKYRGKAGVYCELCVEGSMKLKGHRGLHKNPLTMEEQKQHDALVAKCKLEAKPLRGVLCLVTKGMKCPFQAALQYKDTISLDTIVRKLGTYATGMSLFSSSI